VVTHQFDDDRLVYLLFATPERDAKSYAATLDSMVRSIEIDDGYQQ
jgi:hypothetical protein